MSIVAIGEILWDVFPDGERLGGAALNFAAHARRLGHEVVFLSAVGRDERGRRARERAAELGLSPDLIQETDEAPTGVVTVSLDASGQPDFTIQRPAAYDALQLAAPLAGWLRERPPEWLYHGTLYPFHPRSRETLRALGRALPAARRFYDVNLRRNCYTPALVRELLEGAAALKLNQDEAAELGRMNGERYASIEEFCRAWSGRLGLAAIAVTRGENGCAVRIGESYAEAPGYRVQAADTVGAGDAFAAAFLHGIMNGWEAARTADFANRVGALVASRPGGTPEWRVEEADELR